MSEQSSTTGHTHFYEIDLFRFLGAFMVMFAHYTARGAETYYSDVAFPEIAWITKYGIIALDLFFMISGFVILITVHKRSAFDYMVSRFSRIYPLYWFCLTFTVLAILLLSDGRFDFTWEQVALNYTLFQTYLGSSHLDGVYWTLLVELKFYFWIWMLMLTNQIHHVQRFMYFWGAISLVYLWVYPSGVLYELFVPEWSGHFLTGAAFFLAFTRGWRPSTLGLLALAFTVVMSNVYQRSNHDTELIVSVCAMLLYYGFFVGAITGYWDRFVGTWKWTAALGGVTFPLYLTHQYLGYMLFNLTQDVLNRWVALLVIMIIASAIATLIHFYYEVPSLNWTRKVMRSFKPYMPARLLKPSKEVV